MDKQAIFLYTLKKYKKQQKRKKEETEEMDVLLGEVEKFLISPAESHAIKLLLGKPSMRSRKKVCFLERPVYVGESSEVVSTVPEVASGSPVIGQVGEQPSGFVQQTTTFSDNQDIKFLDMSQKADETRSRVDDVGVNALARFLERPRRIANFEWVPGGAFNPGSPIANTAILDPWSVFLSNSMTFKLNNFRNFRCSGLKLQFRINGSPFHYGRLYVSYVPGKYFMVPYENMMPLNTSVAVTNYGTLNAQQFPLKTHWSQFPGVFIDPTTNDVAELTVPFFWPMNYVSLVANNPSQVSELGRLVIWVLNPLRHTQGVTVPITVQVMAWTVDPVLTVPTQSTAYSGESNEIMRVSNVRGRTRRGKDEYTGEGVVSKPASALARFAGRLSDVPVIGPYATATRMASGALASIASLFGYSRPLVVEKPLFVNQRPFGPIAVTTGEDTALKLTLDPKQEITIDPVVTGLQGIDEMSFAHMCKRESLVLQFNWLQSEANHTNLAHILVHPGAYPAKLTGTQAQQIHFHTALSFAVNPFMFWKGTLNYRIQVVASQMHRGRLAIVYNPHRSPVITSLPDPATTYQEYMDITECRDHTFSVRYVHPNPAQKIHGLNQVAEKGSGNFAAETNLCANGILSIYVSNRLASPSGTADVQVNVFVSAGDDFQFGVPSNEGSIEFSSPFTNFIESSYNPLSSEAQLPVEEVQLVGESSEIDYTVPGENAATSQVRYTVLNGSDLDVPDVDNDMLVFFGEQNVSLRSLLKRYCLYSRRNFATDVGSTDGWSIRFEHPHITQWPGSAEAFPSSTNHVIPNLDMGTFEIGDTIPFNYVRNTYLSYYRIAFAAYRGNVRYKYVFQGAVNQQPNGAAIVVCRSTGENGNSFPENLTPAPLALPVSGAAVKNTELWIDPASHNYYSGSEIEYGMIKNGIEFEHPYYANQRFTWTMQRPEVSTNANSALTYQSVYLLRNRHQINAYINGPSRQQSLGCFINSYAAAGEDFSLHYFCAAPVLGIVVPNRP